MAEVVSSRSQPLRVGVVGLGWAGQQHMERYAARPDVQLVGIAGLEEDQRAELAQRYQVPLAVADWQELIDRGELDALSVAPPTFLHAPVAIAALQAGAPVLTEKPMARTSAEAEAMVTAAREAGRVLQVAFNYRYRGDISALGEQVEQGVLGRVYHARAWWLRRAGIPTLGSWFTNREMAGGGPLIDLGVHVLDATLQLMGNPEVAAVSALTHAELGQRGLGGATSQKQSVGSAYEVEDLAVVLLRMTNGSSLALESSWATHRPQGDELAITLYGTEAGADLKIVDYAPETTVRIYQKAPDGTEDLELPGRPGTGHTGVVDSFLDAVADPSGWPEHDGSAAAHLTQVIEACYLSAEQNREVRLTGPSTHHHDEEATR